MNILVTGTADFIGMHAAERPHTLRHGMGADGFGIALVSALGSLLKYAKAREPAPGCADRADAGH